MKKLVLITILTTLVIKADYNHDSMVQAVIDSNLSRVEILQSGNSIPADKLKNLLELSDEVIRNRGRIVEKTIYKIMPSKEVIQAGIFNLIALLDFGLTITLVTNPDLVQESYRAITGAVLVGACLGLGYLTVSKFIDAYNKPRNLYVNALKIKQLLLSLQ